MISWFFLFFLSLNSSLAADLSSSDDEDEQKVQHTVKRSARDISGEVPNGRSPQRRRINPSDIDSITAPAPRVRPAGDDPWDTVIFLVHGGRTQADLEKTDPSAITCLSVGSSLTKADVDALCSQAFPRLVRFVFPLMTPRDLELLAPFFRKNRRLPQLHLPHHKITPTDAPILADTLSSLVALKHLDLSTRANDHILGDRQASLLVSKLRGRNLELLNLAHTPVGPHVPILLTAPTHLLHLNLCNTGLTDWQAAALATLPYLVHLDVRENHLTSLGFFPGLKDLKRLLASNNDIETLDPSLAFSPLETFTIDENPIANMVEESSTISQLRTLRLLDISNISMNTEQLRFLLSQISGSLANLEHFYMCHCCDRLEDDEALYLTNALSRLPQLQELDLSGIRISYRAAQNLLLSLASSHRFKSLTLDATAYNEGLLALVEQRNINIDFGC